jgi:hypothetical protein
MQHCCNTQRTALKREHTATVEALVAQQARTQAALVEQEDQAGRRAKGAVAAKAVDELEKERLREEIEQLRRPAQEAEQKTAALEEQLRHAVEAHVVQLQSVRQQLDFARGKVEAYELHAQHSHQGLLLELKETRRRTRTRQGAATVSEQSPTATVTAAVRQTDCQPDSRQRARCIQSP